MQSGTSALREEQERRLALPVFSTGQRVGNTRSVDSRKPVPVFEAAKSPISGENV
jgi:hypothetical protein